MRSYIRTEFLEYFIVQLSENVNETDATKKTKIKNESLDKWLAYLFMNNRNQSKYGSLVKKLQWQYALGTDQYPKTLTEAIDALSNHSFDAQLYKNRQKRR